MSQSKGTHYAWSKAEYPWDNATCHNCLTLHARGFCNDPEHAELIAAVKKAGFATRTEFGLGGTDAWYKRHIRAARALRKRFAAFFPAEVR